MMQARLLAGKIALCPPGGIPGPYERFTITLNPDGSRGLRTVTRSPNGTLLRDVNLLVAPDWRDIEGMGRLFRGGEAQGTVLRRVIGDRLYSYAWQAGEQMDMAAFDFPDGVQLGFHPIQLDAWKMRFLETDRDALQPVIVHTVSQSWNGKSLGHGGRVESRARYAGVETIEVPAGRFECDKFIWMTSFGDELHVYRSGPHHLLAKMVVAKSGKGDRDGTAYLLTELEEEIVG